MSWQKTLDCLEKGTIRSATKENGKWMPNVDVKKNILEAFKAGELVLMDDGHVDKHNLCPRTITPEDKIRLVPFGSTIRRGAYVSPNVVIMPPSYINIGAYVGEGTLIDSHVLIGSCAQIGKNVHISAGVSIGGVLEPIGLTPVIIEDNCFIGAGAIIVEGVAVLENAVIAPGVILSKSIPVYDAVMGRLLEELEPIPPNAVVVSGSRAFKTPTPFIREHNLSLNCAIIIKYRDKKTEASVELEKALR